MCICRTSEAEVRLPALISHGMILQQGVPVRIWGSAAPGEPVTVAFAGQQAAATADAQGRWRLRLAPLAAGGPHTMTVSGSNTLTVTNILVGEVWFASGQSNMQMEMSWPSFKHREEIAQADWPQIREFAVQRKTDIAIRDQTSGIWRSCSPETVADFSAAAYFFAREVHRHLHVPVGIIKSAWGGTAIESWISRDGLSAEPALQGALANFDRDSVVAAGSPKELKLDDSDWMKPDFDDHAWKTITLPLFWDYALFPIEYGEGVLWARRSVDIPAAWAGKRLKIELAVDDWETTYFNGQEVGHSTTHSQQTRAYEIPADRVKAGAAHIAVRATKLGWGGIIGDKDKMRLTLANDPAQKIPLAGEWRYAPAQLGKAIFSPQLPTVLYNAMVAPVTPYTIRGAIWYQGEANASGLSAFNYRKMLPALIRDWRHQWGQGDFPFYFVQLTNFRALSDDPNQGGDWPVLRESQAEALAVTNTGMAVTIDIGEAGDIHPGNKWDVGRRLALAALEKTYGQNVQGQSPLFDSLSGVGGAIRVGFKHADDGLVTKDGGPVKGFAVAGADGRFVWAEATIDGSAVIVRSDKVPQPVAVRYAWGDNPACNLIGRSGLPASPFRATLPADPVPAKDTAP